jgi:hypothetical protein
MSYFYQTSDVIGSNRNNSSSNTSIASLNKNKENLNSNIVFSVPKINYNNITQVKINNKNGAFQSREELTPEEEKKLYKKVLKTSLI